MPKTIKFNLVLDNAPVRNLEDLKAHFNVHDLLELHESGLLAKWLTVRGYDNQAADVNALATGPGQEGRLVKEFVRIFEMPATPVEVHEAAKAAEFHALSVRRREAFGQQDLELSAVVGGYHQGFDALIASLHANSGDYALIKKALSTSWDKYPNLMRLYFKDFFHAFFSPAPLVVFTALMHPNLRGLLLGDPAISKVLSTAATDKSVHMKVPDSFLKRYDQATDSFWKDLVEKDKQVMVICIAPGTYVRSTGVSGEESSAEVANGHYLLLRGLDYKNNKAGNALLYMEL
jgi:hypothetical protein